MRRQELLQKHVERCEEILSAKAEAKEALAKEVTHSSELAFDVYIWLHMQ